MPLHSTSDYTVHLKGSLQNIWCGAKLNRFSISVSREQMENTVLKRRKEEKPGAAGNGDVRRCFVCGGEIASA